MFEKSNGLFRKESMQNVHRSLEGDVLLGAPPKMRTLVFGVGTVVFFLTAFLFLSTYTRKETVQGWLVPEGGFIRVVAREGGTITKLNVLEGERILKGASIANLKLSQNKNGDVGVFLESQAKAELSAYEAGIKASMARLQNEKLALETRLSSLRSERLELAEQNKASLAKENLIREDYLRVESLASKGFITYRDRDLKKSELLAAQQALAQGRAALLSVSRLVNETESSLQTLPMRIEELKSQSEAQVSILRQKITQLSASTSSDLIAPVAGQIAAIPVNEGQTMNTGGVVAILIPSNSKLIAELLVPSRAIGFVQTGQTVNLRFQAFSYEKFGVGKGKIVSISRTLISSTDVPISGVEIKEPVFRIKVAVDSQSISAYGQNIPLQPGMLLSGQVELDRRGLYEWLFDPIYALGRR